MLHSACTDCSVEEAAHKEAFSLLSPLTLPLLPASLLYQTSLAFHCTAFQCITDHFTEFQSTELHFMSMNCIVDFLGIVYMAAAAKPHMHFKAQYTLWSQTLGFTFHVLTNFPSFVTLITRDLVPVKVLILLFAYNRQHFPRQSVDIVVCI